LPPVFVSNGDTCYSWKTYVHWLEPLPMTALGAGICAERTAISKAVVRLPSLSLCTILQSPLPSTISASTVSLILQSQFGVSHDVRADHQQSEGHTKVTAVAVTSHLPTPISPCGLCRQVLREFLPLSAPVYMVASSYPSPSTSPPAWLSTEGFGEGGKGIVEVRTLEELLPLSFGPEQLAMKR